MPTAVEDIMDSVASGVLRALEARNSEGAALEPQELVRNGFTVSVVIRAGGIPGPPTGPLRDPATFE